MKLQRLRPLLSTLMVVRSKPPPHMHPSTELQTASPQSHFRFPRIYSRSLDNSTLPKAPSLAPSSSHAKPHIKVLSLSFQTCSFFHF
jgi:hypothetical protein